MHHLNGKTSNFLSALVKVKTIWLIFLPVLFGLFLSQEGEERAQNTRQKLCDLEEICKERAQEYNSVRNPLSDAHKECSSLLAACALLSGPPRPLCSRLCAASSQRDLLQEQVNLHQLENQKIRSLLYALPTKVANREDEARLRQRRAKDLVDVFPRAGIAKAIINTCPVYQLVQPPVSMAAINPQGLQSLQLEQTNFTRQPSLEKYKIAICQWLYS